jgi:hypothetical protein
MTDRELIFDNGKKRRNDCASGKIYVPEAAEEE